MLITRVPPISTRPDTLFPDTTFVLSDIDDLADLVEDLPDTVIDEVLKSMDRENRERLEQALSYQEDTAGRLMNPDVVTVRADTTVDVVLRSEEHTSELQSLMRISYAVDCLKNKQQTLNHITYTL